MIDAHAEGSLAYPALPDGDRLTIEEFERLPDEACRRELVRGVVVRAPLAGFDHGRCAVEIGYHLGRYVEAHPIGTVCGAETGFILSTDPPTVRAPDAAFAASERIPPGGVKGFFPGAPDLAVEIVSPSDRASEIQAKVFDYLDAGARLVWVVYPEPRTVAVHRMRAEARFLTEGDALDGGGRPSGLPARGGAVVRGLARGQAGVDGSVTRPGAPAAGAGPARAAASHDRFEHGWGVPPYALRHCPVSRAGPRLTAARPGSSSRPPTRITPRGSRPPGTA